MVPGLHEAAPEGVKADALWERANGEATETKDAASAVSSSGDGAQAGSAAGASVAGGEGSAGGEVGVHIEKCGGNGSTEAGAKAAEESDIGTRVVAPQSTSQEFSSPFPIIVFEGLKVSLRPATRSNDWYSQPITSVTR